MCVIYKRSERSEHNRIRFFSEEGVKDSKTVCGSELKKHHVDEFSGGIGHIFSRRSVVTSSRIWRNVLDWALLLIGCIFESGGAKPPLVVGHSFVVDSPDRGLN